MTRPRARILFGGSFDPPTRAHRELIEIGLHAFPKAELIVLPAGQAPHKLDAAPTSSALRLAMARLAFGQHARVRVSDEECQQAGPSYTYLTIERHRRELGADAELYWLIGSDSLLDFPTWRYPRRILELAQVLTVARPGFDVGALAGLTGLDRPQKRALRDGILDGAGPPISSTLVRAKFAAQEDVSRFVEPAVLTFIEEHGLYTKRGED